jgi:hypothetical protein
MPEMVRASRRRGRARGKPCRGHRRAAAHRLGWRRLTSGKRYLVLSSGEAEQRIPIGAADPWIARETSSGAGHRRGLLVVGWWRQRIANRLTRPLRRLAAGAEALGRGAQRAGGRGRGRRGGRAAAGLQPDVVAARDLEFERAGGSRGRSRSSATCRGASRTLFETRSTRSAWRSTSSRRIARTGTVWRRPLGPRSDASTAGCGRSLRSVQVTLPPPRRST